MILDWKSLPKPIIALSPMADMTDSAFCRVVKNVTTSPNPSLPGGEGASAGEYPIMFREMVSAEAVVRGNDKTLDMTEIHPAERPLVQQIFGSDPATMAEAARIIAEQHQPEGFDVNMGCPVYKIVHNFNGAALMKEPELATKIVKSMKAVIDVPLSVKIRLGWSDPTECITFAKVLEDAGVDLLTIHGRTKMQGYSGVADWEMIRRAKEAVSVPVLANGDVHKSELIPQALDVSHCDGVLIARGALGNPWIFKQFKDIQAGKQPEAVTLEERMRVVRLHLKLHVEQYGPNSVNTFRKHLSWYFKGLPGFKQFKEPMMKALTADDLEGVFTTILPS
jgi:nifR3 family TIM-barrel protein